MRKLHIAISTEKIEATIKDYSERLGCPPCSSIPGEYALWRTDSLNLSVRQDPSCAPCSLRHLGWERFTARHQADEINELWPDADYEP